MLMGFLMCSCFCWYVHGFFDVFVHLFRFRCYAHGCFDIVVLGWYAQGFFDVFAPLARCYVRFYFVFLFLCLHTLFVLAAMLPS